jgi:glycosyltransferase involved in cell wall biosynthesis
VIITCFNEAHNIEACLESVSWADEILVVDSFSTDNTLEIARRYTPRILEHEYENSAAQKNWAIPQASHDWILIVDSDERVTPELRDEIIALMESGPALDGYWIGRINYLFGKRVNHSGWGRDSVLRFFKRDLGRYQKKRVHAEVELEETAMLKARFTHDSIQSISAWIRKIDRYSTWKATDKFERGVANPYLYLVLRPPLRMFKDYILRLGILDGWRGWLIAMMSASAELLLSAKIVQFTVQAKLKATVS